MTASQPRMQDLPLKDVLASIAAKTPTPGGGAVACITAALASTLAEMVVNYSLGKKSLAEFEPFHRAALGKLQAFADRALSLAEVDAQAYERMNLVWKLDRADPRRAQDLPAAAEHAIQPPLRMLQTSVELLRLLRQLAGKSNAQLNSDLAIAAILADAAARAAEWNIRINLPLLDNDAIRQSISESAESLLNQARALSDETERACAI